MRAKSVPPTPDKVSLAEDAIDDAIAPVAGAEEEVLVARDGAQLGSAAFYCDTLGVNPGERFDAIVECDRVGVWAFHCHILPHVEGLDGMFGMVTALVVQE